jgi:enediyne biosynthesis thioesterase
MSTFIHRPQITFEDTNLVGNVYFSNIVRWQNECRNEWLKTAAIDQYGQIFMGLKRFVVSDVVTRFLDPVGASLGDKIEVEMSIHPDPDESYLAKFEIRRKADPLSNAPAAILATGSQRFTLVSGIRNWESRQTPAAEKLDGPAFVIEFPLPLDGCRQGGRIEMLDLIRWQGKCRERFLSEHAPETLQSVAAGSLVLHTSQVGLRLHCDAPAAATDSMRMEMQLSHLKGGRLTMVFSYFIVSSGNSEHQLLIATGTQSLCCKRMTQSGVAPAVFPVDMLCRLLSFAESEQLLLNIAEALAFADEGLQIINEVPGRSDMPRSVAQSRLRVD